MNRKLAMFTLSFIIFLEIAVIFYISTQFSDNLYITGKFIVVEPMEKTQFVFKNESEGPYAYFYEPDVNMNEVVTFPTYKRTVIETTNEDSLYERYNYTVKKPEGTYRIITLGDSFTQGVFVNISDNYPEILEDMFKNYSKECESYNKFEVINLGVSGYDIAYSVERFKTRGLKYSPDLMLWNIKGDDFLLINSLWMNFTKHVNFPDSELDMENFNKAWSEKIEEFINFLKNFDDDSIKEDYILEPLEYFLSTSEKEDIKVVIFHFFQGSGSIWDYLIEEEISKYNNVDYIRLGIDPKLYSQNLTIYYSETRPHLSDPHPNERGHKIVASKLYDYITTSSNILRDC